MFLNSHNSWRVVANILAAGAVLSVRAGEKVIFSNPDEPLIAPKAAQNVRIPEPSKEIRGFGFSAPQPEMPFIPPPVRPSESKKPEKKTIFDEPAIFSDKQAEKQKEQENGLGSPSPYGRSALSSPYQSFGSPWADSSKNGEQDRALSPVRQYDWSPDFSGARQKGEEKTARWQDAPTTQGLFAPRGQETEAEPRGFLGWLRPSVKRELTPEQLERKAEFEKLLNPSFAPLARTPVASTPNSSPLDMVKAPAPILSAATEPAMPRRSLDPMESYHERQRALRGPSMDDINRKVFGAAAVPPPRAPETTPLQRKPLKSQPIFQEFPTRQF